MSNKSENFCQNLIIIAFLLVLSTAHCKIDINIHSEAAILINANNDSIIFEKNSRKKYFPASITKIATAMYAIKMIENDMKAIATATQDSIGAVQSYKKKKSNYSLPPHWLEFGSNHIGIKAGEKLSIETLMYGMMLASGNDAANVIAEFVSGSIPKFVEELNSEVKSLMCFDTNFMNPHGLHHPDHVTTAFDMALIAKEALKSSVFRKIITTTRWKRPKTNMQDESVIIMGNKLVVPNNKFYYKNAIGIKTGLTQDAGNTFVAAAEKDERLLIAVLLKSENNEHKYIDAIKLFDKAFEERKIRKKFVSKDRIFSLTLPNCDKVLEAKSDKDYFLDFFDSEAPKIVVTLEWNKVFKFPINAGDIVGKVIVADELGNVLEAISVKATEDVHRSTIFQVIAFIKRYKIVFFVASTFFVILAIAFYKIAKR